MRRQPNAYRRDELDYRRQQVPEAVVSNKHFVGHRDLTVTPWAGWPDNVSQRTSVSGLRSTGALWEVMASGPGGVAGAGALAGRAEEARLRLWPPRVLPDPPSVAQVDTELQPEGANAPVGDPLDAWLVAGPGISRSAQPWSRGASDNRQRAGGRHRARGRRWHAAASPQRS